jgi:hypothetical protein
MVTAAVAADDDMTTMARLADEAGELVGGGEGGGIARVAADGDAKWHMSMGSPTRRATMNGGESAQMWYYMRLTVAWHR